MGSGIENGVTVICLSSFDLGLGKKPTDGIRSHRFFLTRINVACITDTTMVYLL